MPRHEYVCGSCGSVYDRIQSSNPPEEPCGVCGDGTAVRQFPNSIGGVKVEGGTPIHHTRAPRR